ncbi:hypothetical protein CMO92_02910 [Candidatus Woesearchaeota archaeon]|nr:hypothetical protein [Candidatus Woesearchaeota archaeon]|tara:strand:- start:2230 stop:2631 length:402 start_codon:yes stop_codon:yes gene_type:complete
MNLKGYRIYAAPLLRIALSLVFLWFGLNQLLNGQAWLGWLPSWTVLLPISGETLLLFNGGLETLFGLFLLLGIFTRVSSLVLGLHLLVIAASLGYSDVMVRDLGLTLATLAVFLQGQDLFCLESRWEKSKTLL